MRSPSWTSDLSTVIAAVVLAMGFPSTAVAAGALAPCARLADLARTRPAGAWAEGMAALGPSLSIQKWGAPATPEALRIANLPLVKQALSVGDGLAAVQRLAPGVYVASAVAGTLDCESIVAVRAQRGGAVTKIASPPTFSDLCWTDGGAPGLVFGEPAFIETSAFADPGADEQHLEVTPWTGAGWGPSCRLSLRYRIAFRLSERFCGDAQVCAAAAPLAEGIAAAYARTKSGASFNYGPPPSKEAQALLASVGGARPDDMTPPPFSTFGAKARTGFTSYSYNGITLFPLMLDGRPYVAAIGYGGVGWREIGDSLFAVYRVEGGQLQPLAGFVTVRRITGLARAMVTRPEPPPPK